MHTLVLLLALITNIRENDGILRRARGSGNPAAADRLQELYRGSAALLSMMQAHNTAHNTNIKRGQREGDKLLGKGPVAIDVDYTGGASGELRQAVAGGRRTYYISNDDVLQTYLNGGADEKSSSSDSDDGSSDQLTLDVKAALRNIRRNVRLRISKQSEEYKDNAEPQVKDAEPHPSEDIKMRVSDEVTPSQPRLDYVDNNEPSQVTAQTDKQDEKQYKEKETEENSEINKRNEWDSKEEATTQTENWDMVTKKWKWDKSVEKEQSWEEGDKKKKDGKPNIMAKKVDIDWGDDGTKDSVETTTAKSKNTAKKWDDDDKKWDRDTKDVYDPTAKNNKYDDYGNKKMKDQKFDDYGSEKKNTWKKKEKKKDKWDDSYRDVPKKTYETTKYKPKSYNRPRMNYDKPKKYVDGGHMSFGRTPVPIVGKRIVYDDK